MGPQAHGTGTRHVSFERERGVYEVNATPDVAHVVITLKDTEAAPEQVLAVLKAVADRFIPIFIVKVFRTALSFATEGARVPALEAVLTEQGLPFTARRDLALVCLVATSMRDQAGAMVRIADALQEAGARMYGLGDSHNVIQALIPGDRAAEAVTQLQLAFGLEEIHG